MRGQIAADVFVLCNPDRALRLELMRPTEGWILKAAIRYEQFSTLRQSCSCLNQRPGSLPGLHDDRRFRQCRHRLVPLREKSSISPKVLLGVSINRYLRNQEKLLRDLFL